jgi:3-oxoacyl-[acyl-carrier protein] reductase
MKYALITGATGVIGEEIVKKISQDGFGVFIHYHKNKKKAQKIKQDIQDRGGIADIIAFDIKDDKAVECKIKNLKDKFLISVLVNNAGINWDVPMLGMTQEQWRAVIDTNLNGFFNLTSKLLMPMTNARWGRIISVSSVAAVLGNRGQANYAASKAGIIAASKTLSCEMAKRGICVNVVVPGIIESSMTDKVFDKNNIKRLVPTMRAGKAKEVADLVSFLCSDRASYITGQAININGGMI